MRKSNVSSNTQGIDANGTPKFMELQAQSGLWQQPNGSAAYGTWHPKAPHIAMATLSPDWEGPPSPYLSLLPPREAVHSWHIHYACTWQDDRLFMSL